MRTRLLLSALLLTALTWQAAGWAKDEAPQRTAQQILDAWKADPEAPRWEMGDLAPWMENGKYASAERRAAAPFWMGPAGFKAKLDRDARTYVVTEVVPGAPGDGKVAVGETIVGANGLVFADSKDADDYPEWARSNVLYGNAIQHAWEQETPLELLVVREGATVAVPIAIPGAGSFGPKFPYESPLADALITMSCELLAARQNDDGSWSKGNVKQGGGNRIATSLAALTLMASGDKRYMKRVRKAAAWVTKQGAPNGFQTWHYSYQALFLGEYHLLTGDKKVLKALQHYGDELSVGQFDYHGSGHLTYSGNYRGGGFTIGTTHALLGMAYASLCGCEVDRDRLRKTMDHIERISPHGGVPYGIWGNQVHKLDEDVPDEPAGRNEHAGRSGSAAAGFRLLGGNRRHLRRLGQFLATNSDWMDNGHASGNSVSWLWGSLGLWLTDEEAFARHMQRRQWWLAMKRRHDGGTMAQPAECINFRSGDGSLGPNVEVAVQTLVLAAPRRKLLVTGREHEPAEVEDRESRLLPMVFIARHEQRTRDLEQLATYFDRHLTKPKPKRLAVEFAEECLQDWTALDPDDRKRYADKSEKLITKQAKGFQRHLDELAPEQRSAAVELFTGIHLHAKIDAEPEGATIELFAGYVPFGEIEVMAMLWLDGGEFEGLKNSVTPKSRIDYRTRVGSLNVKRALFPADARPELTLTAKWLGLELTRTYLPIEPSQVPKFGYTGASPLVRTRATVVGWSKEGMKARTATGREITYSLNAMGRYEDGEWKALGKAKADYVKALGPGTELEFLTYEIGPNKWFIHAVEEVD